MPEGPSIVILKEELKPFEGKKVVWAKGNAKIDMKKISGQKILSFESWGKHFLIRFKNFYIRIHLLMFGTYRVNERKSSDPRLSLQFGKGEVNFYTCSVRLFEEDMDETYDWSADVMSGSWSPVKAIKNLKDLKKVNICDALLNQEIFSGVGNIIKNEVLFRTKIHPKNLIENLPAKKIKELVCEARNYSFDFYEWKKIFELKKHWLIYKKKECPRCKMPAKKEYLGKGKRLTCFCNNCQIIYK